jgi:hypothetical protein
MALKNDVYKQKVKNKGTWNYQDFYNFCFEWIKDNGYGIAEKEYTEKVGPNGKEIMLEWEGKKGVTDYFKNILKVKMRVLGLKDVEVEQEGKKINTNKGDLTFELTATLEKDPEDRWEKKPLWKFLRGIYEKYIIRTTVDQYEDRLKDDAKELISQVKSFLLMGK